MGGHLHVDVHEGRGPHALVVHGMLSSRSYWLANIDALSAVCCPVVVELFGHGRSPSPDEAAAYHPDAYVAGFEQIRESVGADRWFVIGHSLGGALTLHYALERPDQVIAQVFTNSQSALGDREWSKRIRESVAGTAAAVEARGTEVLAGFHPSRARRFPADVQAALLADFPRHDPKGVANTLRHTVPDSSVRDRVAANSVPALLTVGRFEHEFAEPRAFAEAAIPHLEVVDLDAGHAVNVQAADAWNAAVTRFLADYGR